MCIYTVLFSPFPFSIWSLWLFCKIPGQWHTAKTPRGNSSSTKWRRKRHTTSLLNPSHPFSEYKPELRLWKHSCVRVYVCVSGCLEGSSKCAVLCSCSRYPCKRSLVTSRVCCRSWDLLRLSGNCWSGLVDFAINCYEWHTSFNFVPLSAAEYKLLYLLAHREMETEPSNCNLLHLCILRCLVGSC